MASSNPRDGFRTDHKRIAGGKGNFIFINENKNIDIEEMKIEVDLDLYRDLKFV
jgi:hypothetical protein